MRHKHADLIHAWAEGAEIEVRYSDGRTYGAWVPCETPTFVGKLEYRIKPENKPDVVKYLGLANDEGTNTGYMSRNYNVINHWPIKLKLTFSGETDELIKAEIL